MPDQGVGKGSGGKEVWAREQGRALSLNMLFHSKKLSRCTLKYCITVTSVTMLIWLQVINQIDLIFFTLGNWISIRIKKVFLHSSGPSETN